MTTKQINEITADIRAYIGRKIVETGADYNAVCLAVARATLLSQVEGSEHLQYVSEIPDRLMNCKMNDFSLSARTEYVLGLNNITTVRNLVRLHRSEFAVMRRVGPKTLCELDGFLAAHNLHWCMDI